MYGREREDHHHHHHHHDVTLVARISLTLSRHSSLSFIALGRSSGQHPVSSHSCWMYVRAGCPAFARPCVGVHKSTSLMSSSLLCLLSQKLFKLDEPDTQDTAGEAGTNKGKLIVVYFPVYLCRFWEDCCWDLKQLLGQKSFFAFFVFNSISTFVGYLMPNLSL